jgi:hypothetical protein
MQVPAVTQVGLSPEARFRQAFVWPTAIFMFVPATRKNDEYGLRPNATLVSRIPGALPQATVKEGLRPKEFSSRMDDGHARALALA